MRRKRRDRPQVSIRVRQIWEIVTTSVALLAGVYLILVTIEPTRLVIERYVGRLELSGLVALIGVMLEVTTIAVYQLGREVRGLRTRLAGVEREAVTHSLTEVLSSLENAATGRRQRRLEVLGLTLNTVWPVLATWLTSHDRPTGWRITLLCLDPDFIDRAGELPGEWAAEARRTTARIRSFLDQEAEDLHRRGIVVELKSYACVPVVHGFRFGDGTVFASYLQWTEGDRIRPFEFYDRLSPDDRSPRTAHYRDLFDSWFTRAATIRGVSDAGAPGKETPVT
ncbi:hypothetical protein ACFXPA_08525 [Amycolatopsis sp. NPDC059090]|uniref:hypothetical protein n=1 Tax=unclassified Amycolatopsis TaxID=2618356 RepID=UPI00366E1FB2